MKIKITRNEKIALLEALKMGVIDTEKIPSLKRVLNEVRPDISVKEISDAELDQRIAELEQKLRINQPEQPNA